MKKNVYLTGFLSLLFVMTMTSVFSQTQKSARTVTGIVSTLEEKTPMEGISVWVKGTSNATATNASGYFELQKVNGSDVIVFSMMGYKTQEYVVQAEGEGVLSITLSMEIDLITFGELAVNDVYEPQRSAFKKCWSKVKSVF